MTKNNEIEQKYIKTMLENNLFAAIFPKDRSEESALKLVDMIDSAVGIAEFKNEAGEPSWGVIIDKVKEAQKQVKLREEKNDSNL
jgi:hypothetical protein